MQFKRQRSQEVTPNLTPLIDVVFLLLIFFMVSTTFTKETHLSLKLPEAEGEKQTDVVDSIDIVISPNGQYSINQKSLVNNTLETLKKALDQVSNGDNTIPLVITADANTTHQSVVRAMDAAGQMGFSKLQITTLQPSGG